MSVFKLPRPLSHSSISMYGECPQKYKFKYIDGIPEKPRHFFSFGSSVHLALEFFYGVKAPPPPTLAQVLGFYKENWISAGYRDEAQEAEYFEDGKEILGQFHAKHSRDYHIPFFVEYGFNATVEGVPVTGKVDRIDKLPDGRIAIVDYKTGKALAGGRAEGDSQLTMYQMACETLLGVEVARLVFYHVPTLKEQAVERRSSAQIDGLKTRIVDTAESITKGLFEPKPEERICRWCDYKPICPVFKGESLRPAAEPAGGLDGELTALIDELGETQEKADETAQRVKILKESIIGILTRRGYVRAFGARYQVSRTATERWEFSDKKKVLELIKKAGFYERILAPSAPKVSELMSDPTLESGLRARLSELGVRTQTPDLRVEPL